MQLRRRNFAEAERELRSAYGLGGLRWERRIGSIARTDASLGWLEIQKNNAAEGEPKLVAGAQ